jgi:PAS domain S-box-containing protein
MGSLFLKPNGCSMPSKPTYEELETRLRELERQTVAPRVSEEVILESEQKYRTLFNDSRDAIYITSREGKFLDVNPALLELLGYAREEMIDKTNVHNIYVNPADRDRFQREIERKGSVRDYEVKFCKKNGTEMDCLLTSTVRRSPNGTVLGYQGIIRDVTERKRAERALQESEARYRAIVEDQTELICRFLPDGTLTFVNDAYCKYFGKKREDLIGHTFMPLIPEEDHEKLKDHFASLSPKSPVATHEHRVIGSHGEIRWQQWTNRMVLDEEGQLIELQSVGRDITERKLMEEVLKSSSEKIKQFAYSVSHDLKSPAIGIHGLTKLLHKRCRHLLDEKSKDYCDRILKAAEQISALVEQINVYIKTSETPIKIQTVALQEIFETVRGEFSGQLDDRQIRWVQPKTVPNITGDRMSILRVLRNLVDNALKHGGDELTEIRLGYEGSDEYHTLSVSDDGVAIKNEDSEKIFGAFQRKEASTGVEGSGLGLAIVKEIAEQHGGTVCVKSGPDKGASFYVSISKSL